MPSYVVETYLARGRTHARAEGERRARSAAEGLTREAARVCFHGSIHILDDEICFYVFDAATAEAAAEAARRAGLDPLRVAEAISSRKGKP